MAYIPPLNGGRLNASINTNGNTAGAAALVSTGTLVLAGGNNITLSQNGGSITISGANPAAASVNFSAGTTSNNLSAVTFANSNAVNFGLNGSVVTASAAFSNANGVSFGLSGGSVITGSHNAITSQSNQTLAYSAGGNTSLTSTGTFDARSVWLNGLGAASAGFSSSSMFVSVPVQSAQTQSNIQAMYDGVNSISTGTIRVSNLNGISFGINGQVLTASHNALTSQSNQVVTIDALGANTTGNSSSGTLNASNFNVSGQGAVYVGMSGNTMQISGATTYAASNHSHGNPTLNLTNLSGTTASASNGLTLSLSAAAQTVQSLGFTAGTTGGGNTSLTSTGTFDARSMYLNAYGAISAGFSNSSIFISAPAQSVQTQNLMTVNGTQGAVSISGGANVTVGNNASTITISAAAQTNQTLGMFADTNGNTVGQSSSTSIDARSLTLRGYGNVSVGYSGGSAIISGAGGGGGAGLSAGTQSVSSGTVNFANSNGITFGMSGSNQITASHNGITSQSNQTVGLYATGNTTGQSSNTSIDARSLTFNGLGAMTVGYSNSSIQLSAPVASSLSATGIVSLSSNGATISIGAPAFSAGMSSLGNTSGTSSMLTNQLVFAGGNNITLSQATNTNGATLSIIGGAGGGGIALYDGAASISSGTVSLADANGVSLGLNGQTLTASVAAQSAQTQSNIQAVVAGASTNSTGTISFANSNGVSFGLSNNTITASVAGGGGGGVALSANTLISSGTASLAGGGAMTITGNGQSMSFNVPATSSLVGINNITVATNGSTISISGPTLQTPTTLSRFEFPEDVFSPLSAIANGSLSIQHMYIPFNVVGASAKIGGSLSVNTSAAASVGSANMSLWMGIYTLSGSTLSLASSGSANNAFSWQAASSVSSTSLTGFQGMRQLTVPMAVNITPGEYWMAAVISSATTAPGAGFTVFGNSAYPTSSGYSAPVLIPIGSNLSSARDALLFEGMYTAVTSAGPSSMSGGQINNTSAANVMRANIYNAIYNATY